MKKMTFIGSIILVFISMALVCDAGMTRVPISPSDIPALKGKWDGTRTIGPSAVLNTELEIYNDTLPIKGKFTFYDVGRRTSMGRTETIEFEKGKINDQGNLLIKGKTENEFELSLFKGDGKMKLEGDFYFMGAKGTMSFKKE